MNPSGVSSRVKASFKKPLIKNNGKIVYSREEVENGEFADFRTPTATYSAMKAIFKEQAKKGGMNNMLNRYPFDIPKGVYHSSDESDEDIPTY